jgi:hypothetical protein
MTTGFLTGGYVTGSYMTGFRTSFIEQVPETHDMARLVADTRAKMKLEKAAQTYVMPDMINTFGTMGAHYQTSPDLIVEIQSGRVEIEAKVLPNTAAVTPADKTKSSTAPTPTQTRATVPEQAPGAKLHNLAKLLLTAEAYRRYVEPHLADVYLEYNNALAAGDVKAANRVVWRGYFEVVKPFAYGLVRSLFRFWLQTRR